jgi:XRE family transcriptional regulator, regulator of sulfur utilization
MITRRDGFVAAVAAVMAAAATLAAQSPGTTALPSGVYDWTTLKVEATPVGEKRAVFLGPTATMDRMSVHVTTINAGEAPHPPHKHLEEEIIIVKEGTIEAMQNGETTVLGPGSVIFEASNDLHGLRNVGDGPATYFVLKAWPPGMLEGTE